MSRIANFNSRPDYTYLGFLTRSPLCPATPNKVAIYIFILKNKY